VNLKEPTGPGAYLGEKLKSLFHDIDHPNESRRLDFRRLNRENPDWTVGMTAEMERNWREAADMLKAAIARFHEQDTGVNFCEDDGDRRYDKREVIYKRRVVTKAGLQVCYDRMRAEAEVKHWKEYLDYSSARDHGRTYVKP
jgi:hypothetical protein